MHVNSFFIAMGQGVVAQADCEVFTEALLSCTFIAGCSASRARGGAFHYPADSLQEVRSELNQWLAALRPVELTLVFADSVSFGIGTRPLDEQRLRSWVREQNPSILVRTTTATAACMRLVRGEFYAGPVGQHSYWDPDEGIDLSAGPSSSGRYQLFDARPNLGRGSAALVQEATGSRKKRRRSKGKCVIL